MKAAVIVVFVLVLSVGSFLLYNMGWTRVDPGNVGLLIDYSSGQVTPVGTGWHHIGRYQKIQTYPLGTQTYIMDDDPAEGQLKGPDSIECRTKDTQVLRIDVATNWRMNPDQAVHMYQNRRDVPLTGPLKRDAPGAYIEDLVVRPAVRSVTIDACTHYGWEDILGAKRQDFQAEIDKAAKDLLNSQDILVENAVVRQARPSEGLAQLMNARLEGQKQAESARFEAEKAARQAELNKTQAEAKAQTDLINVQAKAAQDKATADAANTIKVSTAQADADATRLKGEADAAANAALSKSVTPEMVELERAKRWNGQLPQNIIGGNNGSVWQQLPLSK